MSDVERKKLFCLLVMSSTKSKLDSPFFPQERNHHAKIDSGYLVYSRMKRLDNRQLFIYKFGFSKVFEHSTYMLVLFHFYFHIGTCQPHLKGNRLAGIA